MKKYVLFLSAILVCHFAVSQPSWQWGKEGGGPGNDIGYSISTDPAGNSYVTGKFWATVAFGPNTMSSYGGPDIFVARYSPLGVCVWAHHAGSVNTQDMYGDEGDGIDIDASGNCYVTGNFKGQATFGATVIGNAMSTSRNIFLAKYDANGNLIWATCPVSSPADNYSRSVAVDAAGNSYITGYLGGGTVAFGAFTLSGAGGFVAKYDSSGNVVYATKLGVNGSLDLYGVAVDPAGSAYVTGYLQSTEVINSQTYTATGMRDGILLKVNASGNFLWLQQAQEGANTVCMPTSVCSDGLDGIYWCGETDNTTIFGLDTVQVNPFSSEIFLVKYDTSGAVIWARQSSGQSFSGGTNVFAVTAGSSNVFITGSFANDITFDSYVLSNNGMGSNTFIVAFNRNTGVCQFGIGSEGQNCGAYGHGISTDNTGSVYICGFDKAPVVFGPDTTIFLGGEDFFIAKLGSGKPMEVSELSANPGATVFNSVSERNVHVLVDAETCGEHPDFILYDMQGKELKRIQVLSQETIIGVSDLPTAVYCWRLEGVRSGAGKICISNE